MQSSLPSLAPRGSHALWYPSNDESDESSSLQEPVNHAFDHFTPPSGSAAGQTTSAYSQRRSHLGGNVRSPLARLRADELYMERRKQNVQNYGSSWIKPPGILKSLHQLREEKREMEEHQEALRRELLAQELAEAEAGDALLQGEGPDGEMEAGRDLDDDIPEADTTGVGDDESDTGTENNGEGGRRGMMAQRLPDEAFREALVRGENVLGTPFAGEATSEADGDDPSQILQEEDLIHEGADGGGGAAEDDVGMDMDADLDDDVPDADADEYEHTDTEAELSSSDGDGMTFDRWPRERALSTSMVRSDGTQNSLETGNMGLGRSSPGQGHGNRRGPP